VFVFDHVLDDPAVRLEESNPCEFLKFGWDGEVLAGFADEFAMCSVVVLSPDVVFDEEVDFDVRMD
jgi:hypothetical protein